MADYLDHTRIAQKLLDQQSEINSLTAARDGAYRERAHLVAWLAGLYPAVITPAPDADEPGWQIVYLATPLGQASWHIAPGDAQLFDWVEHVPADDPRAKWDGHTTIQKYLRISSHARSLAVAKLDTTEG